MGGGWGVAEEGGKGYNHDEWGRNKFRIVLKLTKGQHSGQMSQNIHN